MSEPEQNLVLEHPLNAGVLAYLGRDGDAPGVAPPDGHGDPYFGAGSHPDVVTRIWDELGSSMPRSRRCLVCGKPALVLRGSGLVVAVALGTAYAIRLSPPVFREALRAGAETEHRFSTVRTVLDLESTFGDGWVFGTWHESEPTWCASSSDAWTA